MGKIEDQALLVPQTEAARRFGVHTRTLTRWILDRDVNFPRRVRINRRVYFRGEELRRWEAARVGATAA